MEDRITDEFIDVVMTSCKEEVWEPFPGVTIVAWQLPNGFTVSHTSGCVNPDSYSREIGVGVCRRHLRDKLWELYGFALSEQRFKEGL